MFSSAKASGRNMNVCDQVHTPAPAVERADEGPPISVALDELYAAMAAGVVVGPHGVGIESHDDDRLVEDLVFDEVARLGGCASRHAICHTRGQNSSASSA